MNLLMFAASSQVTVLDAPSGNQNGVADQATLQGAIDEMASAGGGIVGFAGNWWFKNLIIRDGVILTGLGMKVSRLNRAAGSTNHGITVDQTGAPSRWGLSNFTIDGHYEDSPDALDNINIVNPGIPFGGEIGGVYSMIEKVASVWAKRDNFYTETVEGRLIHCVGSGARRHNFKTGGSDQFIDHCTSGFADGDGMVIDGLGHRLTGCKSWCAGWRSARGTNFGYDYINTGATNYRVSAANVQITNCESQDAAGSGAVLTATGGQIRMMIDASGSAGVIDTGTGHAATVAVEVDYCEGASIDIAIGNGTSHLGTPTGWAGKIGSNTTNSRIIISGSTQHLANMALRPDSVVAASNFVVVGSEQTNYAAALGGTGL